MEARISHHLFLNPFSIQLEKTFQTYFFQEIYLPFDYWTRVPSFSWTVTDFPFAKGANTGLNNGLMPSIILLDGDVHI